MRRRAASLIVFLAAGAPALAAFDPPETSSQESTTPAMSRRVPSAHFTMSPPVFDDPGGFADAQGWLVDCTPPPAYIRVDATGDGVAELPVFSSIEDFYETTLSPDYAPSCDPLCNTVEARAVTGFAVGMGPTPVTATLKEDSPGPFDPATTIRYTLVRPGRVSLRVYDAGGRLVRTLVDEFQSPADGPGIVKWDGADDTGNPVSSGVYFYRLVAPGVKEKRKVVLLK